MALTYDQISAITEKKFIPKLYDNVFKAVPLILRLRKKMKLLDGGERVLVPLNYAALSANGWYSGPDTLNTADNDVITAAEFQWAQAYQAISITRRDELRNMGDAAKINFVKAKVEIAEKSLIDLFGAGVYSSGTNSKSIIGTGVFLSASNTYGTINQSTNSWWQAQLDSTTTTLSISSLQTMWGLTTVGSDSPTVITSLQARYDGYYGLLQPQQRFIDTEVAEAGFTSLMFNGIPWIVDSKAPTSSINFLNEDYLDLYTHKDENFRFEPFMQPINQNVKVAKLYWMGAFTSANNRMHGIMSAVTN